jgi:hypothetical protein
MSTQSLSVLLFSSISFSASSLPKAMLRDVMSCLSVLLLPQINITNNGPHGRLPLLSLQKLHRYQPMCAPSYIFFSRCKRVGQGLCGASVLPETCFRHRTYVLSLALRGLRGDINQHSFFSALVFFITLQRLLYPNLNLGGICPLCQPPSAEQRCEEATMGRRRGYCSRKDFGFIRCVLLRLSQWISKDYTTQDMSCELDCLGKISPTQ